jgi:hypothetical protein
MQRGGRWPFVVGRWLGPVEGIGIHEKYFDGDFFGCVAAEKWCDRNSRGLDFSQWLREFIKSVDS